MRPPRSRRRSRSCARNNARGAFGGNAGGGWTCSGEHPGGIAMTVRHGIAWLSLLIGSIVAVPSAEATDHPAAGLPPHARAAVRAYEANAGIPAFARKYGMKCSACHLAVPLLTPFGQAFRDNGYRMKNGTDDLRANDPSYWPLFAWLWKDYQLDVD